MSASDTVTYSIGLLDQSQKLHFAGAELALNYSGSTGYYDCSGGTLSGGGLDAVTLTNSIPQCPNSYQLTGVSGTTNVSASWVVPTGETYSSPPSSLIGTMFIGGVTYFLMGIAKDGDAVQSGNSREAAQTKLADAAASQDGYAHTVGGLSSGTSINGDLVEFDTSFNATGKSVSAFLVAGFISIPPFGRIGLTGSLHIDGADQKVFGGPSGSIINYVTYDNPWSAQTSGTDAGTTIYFATGINAPNNATIGTMIENGTQTFFIGPAPVSVT
ncbi:hypothetical protein [Amylibacter sp. IMCC11727]|uniref:hypothetical protein n=1 Tax=Amylibacter sp. IMCC11727 TaxID=3039851 RepID=UPI00244DC366|nr:hypothetical protein [Amylibacter sp. IMCC11727]WGI22293.1 hypothetical protein QBD29_02420 [Amylibacter sp. IMCC11727]